MGKHTPGPWKFEKSTQTGFNIKDHHGNPAIARTYNDDGHNARLIAAAPDLLASLVEIMDILDDKNISTASAGNRARRAIADTEAKT